jgi:hypothetical protein
MASTLRAALTTILAIVLVAHCVLLPGPPLAAVPAPADPRVATIVPDSVWKAMMKVIAELLVAL